MEPTSAPITRSDPPDPAAPTCGVASRRGEPSPPPITVDTHARKSVDQEKRRCLLPRGETLSFTGSIFLWEGSGRICALVAQKCEKSAGFQWIRTGPVSRPVPLGEACVRFSTEMDATWGDHSHHRIPGSGSRCPLRELGKEGLCEVRSRQRIGNSKPLLASGNRHYVK